MAEQQRAQVVVGDPPADSGILVVGHHEAIPKMFGPFANRVALRFLPGSVPTGPYAALGEVVRWQQFRSASHLLRQLRVRRIVFFELETLNQVALNAIARDAGVTTVFCDHGIQDMQISRQARRLGTEHAPTATPLLARLLRARHRVLPAIGDRLFFARSLISARREVADFLRRYRSVRMTSTIFDTYDRIHDSRLYPTEYLCISARNYEFHRAMNHGWSDARVSYFGLPEFDELSGSAAERNPQVALYVDQPYVHQDKYGWTKEAKLTFLTQISKSVTEGGFTLLARPHPREGDFWRDYAVEIQALGIEVVSDTDRLQAMRSAGVVLGFNSTLLLPLAASEGVAVFCLHMHPDPRFAPSPMFVDAGVARWVHSAEELVGALAAESLRRTRVEQDRHKGAFVREWMHAFDGRCGERFEALVLGTGQ
ncbi:MAG: hypothetical protein H6716_26925 [Polyangiaceae bacterium]|nr:hypothetical protein [Polyangiaceae bacterium]